MGFQSMLWYLLVGTRGGANRIRILELLQHGRMNAHELAGRLALDYRTVRHHLSLLEDGNAIFRPLGKTYASPYELTASLLANVHIVEQLRSERVRRIAGRWARIPAVPRAARGVGSGP